MAKSIGYARAGWSEWLGKLDVVRREKRAVDKNRGEKDEEGRKTIKTE